MAQEVGLKGHAKIFGHSLLANGHMKFDYLSQCKISVGGSSVSLVLKVTDNNDPMLLGLDAMIALGWNVVSPQSIFSSTFYVLLGMYIDFRNMTFTVDQQIRMPLSQRQFKFIDYSAYLGRMGVLPTELVPFEELPTILGERTTSANGGTSRMCLDLGTSYGVVLTVL